MMLPCSLAERLDQARSRVISVGGISSGEFGDEDLFRRVAHRCRRVHHEGLGMDAPGYVGDGRIGHVEGRILRIRTMS